jgi:HD-GYP domain-containing protein (c-di-GMP phosphodiesterase class II)
VDSILAEKTEIDQKLLQLASKIDEFEGYGGAHAARIAGIAAKLADSFGLASRDRFFLEQAALIHDMGEMSMNRDYIRSSRGLTSVERLDVQRHPVIGEQDASKLGLTRAVQLIVRWHHEWWNGGGYPDCLEGEQIPLAARIIRLADTYCSMTGTRPFRPALPDEEARKYIREWAGIEFDPSVVKNFLALDLTEFDQVTVPANEPLYGGLSLL